MIESVADGIRLRLYPRGPEVCDRLPDALPSARESGPQPRRGSEHQSGLLVHRGGRDPAGGQRQSGAASAELLLRQEDHHDPHGLVTPHHTHQLFCSPDPPLYLFCGEFISLETRSSCVFFAIIGVFFISSALNSCLSWLINVWRNVIFVDFMIHF